MRGGRLIGLGLVTVLAATLAGCRPTAAEGPGLSVVVGFYPLQFVAEQVGGDRVHVTNLAQPGAEPHDLELRPSQMARIAGASLVLYLYGLQPVVDQAVQLTGATAMDVAALMPLRDAPVAIGPDDPRAERDSGTKDPHVWLDPTRLATIAGAVTEQLAALDPGGAEGYRQRDAELSATLSGLDSEYTDGLRSCDRRDIVVSHAAFGYLADRYGLRQIGITGLSPDAEPTPAHLAAAADEARRVGATTIFFESLASPEVAQSVAGAVGARVAVLDPIEGLRPDAPGDDYVSLMRSNLATLRDALGCAA